jgi:hypothetical protein
VCRECFVCVPASERASACICASARPQTPPTATPLRTQRVRCEWVVLCGLSDLNRDSGVASGASLAAKLEHARRDITHGSVSDYEPFVAPVFAIIHSPYPAPPQHHLHSRRCTVQSVGQRAGCGREGGREGGGVTCEGSKLRIGVGSLGHSPPQARTTTALPPDFQNICKL